MLNNKELLALYLGFLLVYVSGLFIPLMENDSAQHATMAMRMVLENNFLQLHKGDHPYLDKPHMHFWLSALSMKLFGINAIAYRIPALLCLAMGAFSTKKLADLLYSNSNLSHVAALIFLAAQTIILSAHDVRTDAVLTGFIIFSVWQILKFIKTQSILPALLGGLGTALAFSSKGLMGVVIIGFCILAYLLYSREWKKFFNPKLVFLVFSFAIGIIPVLIAYYHQFGREGVEFILINQSFDRLQAKGFEETSPDYFFFFHTLLWAFLPFSLLFYLGVYERTKFFIKTKFVKLSNQEFLTLGGFWFVILLFSFSKFKLPHYLNGLIPILAVFTSAYYFLLAAENRIKKIRVLYYIQIFVIVCSLAGVVLLIMNFSGVQNYFFLGVNTVLLITLILKLIQKENLVRKYLFVSLMFSITVNLYLNTQFYPALTQYQGGMNLAEYFNKHQLDRNKIFMPENYETWSFDFYIKKNTPKVPIRTLHTGDYVIISANDLPLLNRDYIIIRTAKTFRITKLSLKFLNPNKREMQLSEMCLIQLKS